MERPVHQCPCVDCRSGIGPAVEHHRRLNLILSRLDEQRRWVAAVEAERPGHGGINTVAAITGMHPETLRRGRDELAADLADRPAGRVRLPGGGRPTLATKTPPSSPTC